MEEDKLQQHLEMGLLLARYVNDELNADEQQLVNEWLANEDNHKLFNQIIEKDYAISQLARLNQLNEKKSVCRERVAEKIAGLFFVGQKQGWWKRYSYIAAASVVVLLSASVYLLYNHRQNQMPPQQSRPLAHDAEPGKFKAKLKLSDNTEIVLDSALNRQLAEQGGVTVMNKDGKLVYVGKQNSKEALYNTLYTSKGEMYVTVLPDGSRVWINSQSSVKYPVTLSGNEQRIEVTGEAYFDIVHNPDRKMTITVNGVTIEDIGTQFNVNGYTEEENIKATIIEGKIRLVKENSLVVLKAGQQASLPQAQGNNSIKVINDANLRQATAWKDGLFMFGDDDLKTVLRKLGRWYDVEIVYTGVLPDETYTGNFPMDLKLSEVLTVLEKSGIHAKVQGKKLIVSP